MRFRNIYMILGSVLALAIWLLTDPASHIVANLPFGASTVALATYMLQVVLYVSLLHLSRKALMDYLDLKVLYKRALESSEGAGQVFIGVGLTMIAIAIIMVSVALM